MFKSLILTLIATLAACGFYPAKKFPGGQQEPSDNPKAQKSQQGGGITSAGDPTNPVIVSGEIIHQIGQKYSYDKGFNFTAESHATVRLMHNLQSDATARTIKEISFSRVNKLPLAYAISVDSSTGSLEELFAQKGTYSVQVTVHSGPGDDLRVGDLINEIHFNVAAPTANLNIFVTGLEDCEAENAGGACTSIK